ncbi:chromosomal replication initiator protein DnaA [Bradymonas sediminis]|nr:chromosomal replication initiator protein DnaA [Bradymonas sediminis]TDP73894.1 chromosomal replication initiator protein DnaA [Bradymonas sediminis]
MSEIWQAALCDLKEKTSSHNYESWFQNIKCRRREGRQFFLEVRDEFQKAWVEENYLDLIEDSLVTVTGASVEITLDAESTYASKAQHDDVGGAFQIDVEDEPVAARMARMPEEMGRVQMPAMSWDAPAAPEAFGDLADFDATQPAPKAFEERLVEAGLNPRHDFEEFVVGGSNQFVHAACSAVAENPGKSYNPLFIFGGVGLGKTHLLHAVGIEAMKANPQARVVTMSAEEFMNELITSLRQKKMNAFRTQFRNNCDVLLIDDIQFIAGKDSTQEEFFHTFNALYHSGKQIVVTSDKLPRDLPGIEERLRSRFSWGLCADIQPPEMETRIAILEKKAEADGIELSKEMAILLASSIRSNVRELEGTLIRLGAQASLLGQPMSMELARQMLDRMDIDQRNQVNTPRIIEVVAREYGISPVDIRGKRRTRAISKPRQYAMYLARKHTDDSYPRLGDEFGGKDHTTVLAAFKKIDELIEAKDPEMCSIIDRLENLLLG